MDNEENFIVIDDNNLSNLSPGTIVTIKFKSNQEEVIHFIPNNDCFDSNGERIIAIDISDGFCWNNHDLNGDKYKVLRYGGR